MATYWALCAILEAASEMYVNCSRAFSGFLPSRLPRHIGGQVRNRQIQILEPMRDSLWGFSEGLKCLDTAPCVAYPFVGCGEI